MSQNHTIFKIKGKVQQYAWGGFEYIPNLLNVQNTLHQPFAEYWLGAHPSASSEIVASPTISLQQFIQSNPTEVLGQKVEQQFNELPYLFKVLDVHDMLSIQVHPSKAEAIKGFEAEEAAGIAINASNRNYKDKNHKPEVMVALSDFWLLHGFKSKEAIENTLTEVAELSVLLALFKSTGYKGLYQFLMEMEQDQVDTLLLPLVKKEIRRKKDNELTRSMPGWWVAKLYENNSNFTNLDRGIFSIYLFNIVHLQKGEAIFQGAGVPHAYLEGQNVELMANSDNVLRGGLTPKHIDVPELMKHTLFEAVVPNILKGQKLGNEKLYPCPVPDFGITAIELNAGEHYSALTTSLEIVLVIEGALLVKQNQSLIIKKGEALAVVANQEYTVTASGKTLLYKAFVPVA